MAHRYEHIISPLPIGTGGKTLKSRVYLAAVARMFIAEPEYWEKITEERGEDIVPCILCNGCHGMHRCTVNTYLLTRDKTYAEKPEKAKKVAVIGGGTTGRETAVYLAKWGHKATLVARKQVVLFEDPHSQRALEDAALTNPNFSYVEHAATQEIGDGYVICQVKRGFPTIRWASPGICLRDTSSRWRAKTDPMYRNAILPW